MKAEPVMHCNHSIIFLQSFPCIPLYFNKIKQIHRKQMEEIAITLPEFVLLRLDGLI